ncbi:MULTISPECIES: hypothetical protein [unclassified Clostridium]|uniref:hypothetical protein n=1 Tax=unclassified Clostridium TaxID=2614128 RepID=UPI000297DBE6|nr:MULTISPECIES: hypothetical protein [unclassified Clostridium]EKQ56594.1 MAG: hypothetical protein A370_01664 [Clostridium sp. Maddingley MBC34-26]
MKKFFISFLIVLCLFLNMITVMAQAIGNIFKEGFYKASDFNLSSKSNYTIQNVSSTDSVYVLVFDKNHSLYQSIRMEPNSPKYELLSIDPDFRIAIVGKGEVYFS